ncbi:hypothetical protein D3C76_1463710 [compost metagenome]
MQICDFKSFGTLDFKLDRLQNASSNGQYYSSSEMLPICGRVQYKVTCFIFRDGCDLFIKSNLRLERHPLRNHLFNKLRAKNRL